MALHKREESVYLKKKIVFTSRGPLIVRTMNPSMALHKREESVYLKKKFVFNSRGPLIVRTISWAVHFR